MTELQIKCFLELARQLNFTKAAKNMKISQSTLSAHINALEKNLELRLFIRNKRSVRLSPEGEVMQRTFQDALRMIESGTEVARNLQKTQASFIRIGYLEGTVIDVLANEVLKAFEKTHPNTEVSLVRLNHNELSDRLNEYSLDMIFGKEFIAKGRSEWDKVNLFKCPVSVFYAKNLNLNAQRIEDVLGIPWIQVTAETDRTEELLYKVISEAYDIVPEHIKYVNSIEAALLNVEMGRGIYLSDHASRAYGSERFCYFDLNVEVDYCCITRKDNPNREIQDLQKLAASIYDAHIK